MISFHNPRGRQVVVMVYKDQKVHPDSFRDFSPKLSNESFGTLPKLESKIQLALNTYHPERWKVVQLQG